MSTQDNASTKNVIGGAFGGEMKYMFLLLVASAGALFGSFLLTANLLGNTLQAAQTGLLVSLFAGGGTFVIGWLAIYYLKWSYSSSKKSYKLIVRPDNMEWPTLVQDDTKAEEYIDAETQKPTGYRSKQFDLAKPTFFSIKGHECGLVTKYIVQYFGNWKDHSDGQPGYAEYDDMVLPNNFTEILDVEFVSIDVQHGAQIPVFRLIAGRKSGKYVDYTRLIPNPNTNMITVSTGQSIAQVTAEPEILSLRTENRKLKELVVESQRQGHEDKTYSIIQEQANLLYNSEYEGIKGLLNKMHDICEMTIQDVVTAMNDWEQAAIWLGGSSKWHTVLPLLILFAAFALVVGFFWSQPTLTTQLNDALQTNWLLDLAIIFAAIAIIISVYYVFIRRRRKK